MELIRTDTDYAMRLLVHLARASNEQPVGVRTMAAAQGVPEPFAYKILQKLTLAHITDRFMGPTGGFRLAQDPERISLLQVAEAVQGPVLVRDCVLGESACPRHPACSISVRLNQFQKEFADLLRGVTLAEVLATVPIGQTGGHQAELALEQGAAAYPPGLPLCQS